jgi:lipoate-protein ligase A
MRWTLISDPAGHPGWWQMALDQALLDRAGRTGEGFVRCYRWQPWCLSFGRHEPALRRYDRARIEAEGLDVVRRPTGGRAVWHARELTYAVAAPLTAFGGMRQAYRQIHATLARAVEQLGAATALAPAGRPVAPGAGACFSSPAGGEVTALGRKLVGSAQLRQGSAFLQHGSLLLSDDQSRVAAVTRGAAPPGGEITLETVLGHPVSFEAAAAAVRTGFGELARFWDAPPSAEELDALAAIHADRHRDPAWTWAR